MLAGVQNEFDPQSLQPARAPAVPRLRATHRHQSMSLAPSRLSDVNNSAYFKEVCQDNFAVLAEEIAKRATTYQNGSPTTVIGPPASGTRVLAEFWRDGLGGEWVCTGARTPGTWKQIRPAAVTAGRSSAPIPPGYLILTVATGHIKRPAGGYVWEVPGV